MDVVHACARQDSAYSGRRESDTRAEIPVADIHEATIEESTPALPDAHSIAGKVNEDKADQSLPSPGNQKTDINRNIPETISVKSSILEMEKAGTDNSGLSRESALETIRPVPGPDPGIDREPLNSRQEVSLADPLEVIPLVPYPASGQIEFGKVQSEFIRVKGSSLSVYFNGMTYPGEGGKGLGAGLLLNKSLGNKRWTISGGLGYSYIQQPLQVNSYHYAGVANNPTTEVTNSAEIFTGKQESEESLVAEASTVVRTNVKQGLDLHYLEVPIRLSLQMNRWHFSGGVALGVLLTSHSDYTYGGVFQRSVKADDFSFDSQNDPTIGIPVSGKARVNNLDAAITAGVGYSLTSRLSMVMQYRAGVFDMMPDNQYRDFNRLFQAGFQYRLLD